MSPPLRRAAPWLGLALSGAAAWAVSSWPGAVEPEPAALTGAPQAVPKAAAAAEPSHNKMITTTLPERSPWPTASPTDLVSWGPAPVASPPRIAVATAPAPVEATPPAAPTLPYRLMGRIIDNGRQRVMLVGARQTLVVGEQEVVDQHWRVERIGEQKVELLWLPGGLPQSLGFGL